MPPNKRGRFPGVIVTVLILPAFRQQHRMLTLSLHLKWLADLSYLHKRKKGREQFMRRPDKVCRAIPRQRELLPAGQYYAQRRPDRPHEGRRGENPGRSASDGSPCRRYRFHSGSCLYGPSRSGGASSRSSGRP